MSLCTPPARRRESGEGRREKKEEKEEGERNTKFVYFASVRGHIREDLLNGEG